jgi:hypothetical protein
MAYSDSLRDRVSPTRNVVNHRSSLWVKSSVFGRERAEFTLPRRRAAVAATNDPIGRSDVQPFHGTHS